MRMLLPLPCQTSTQKNNAFTARGSRDTCQKKRKIGSSSNCGCVLVLLVILVACQNQSCLAFTPNLPFGTRRRGTLFSLSTSSSSSSSSVDLLDLDAVAFSNNNDTLFSAEMEADVADESLPLQFTTTTTTTTTATTTPLQQKWLGEPSLAKGRLLVLLAAAIYGTNFSAVKMLGQVLPTGVSAVLRFGLAAVVVSAIVLISEQQQQREVEEEEATTAMSAQQVVLMLEEEDEEQARAAASWKGFEVGVWYTFGYVAQSIGLQTVDANKSAFFNALAVVVVPLLDSLIKSKQLSNGMILAITLAIVGVGTLQLGPSAAAQAVHSHAVHSHVGGAASFSVTRGDCFCFSQALFFGVGYWRLETAASQFPNQVPRMTMGQLVGVAVGSLVYCVGQGQVPALSTTVAWLSDPFVVQSIAWTGLVSTALALYLETVALRVVSATELTILMTSVSVWGSAFAYVSMGEVLSPVGMAGGALILLSCVLSATTSASEEQREETTVR